MKREEELTVSVKAEDWENACHELIWLVGDTELFERISNAARMNAEQRPLSASKPEATEGGAHEKGIEALRTIDWRSLFKEVLARMRAAGESQEIGARWFSTAAKEAISAALKAEDPK